MHDLVDDDVLKEVRGVVEQREVEPDPTPSRHTAPPTCRHPAQTQELVPHTDHPAPVREQWFRGGPKFTTLPSIESAQDSRPIRRIRDTHLEAPIGMLDDRRAPERDPDLEAQRLTQTRPHLTLSTEAQRWWRSKCCGTLILADALAVPLDPGAAVADEAHDRPVGGANWDRDAQTSVRRVDPEVHAPDPADGDLDLEVVDLQHPDGPRAIRSGSGPGHGAPRSWGVEDSNL